MFVPNLSEIGSMVLKKKTKIGKFKDKKIDSQTDDEPQMIRKGFLKELKIKRG